MHRDIRRKYDELTNNYGDAIASLCEEILDPVWADLVSRKGDQDISLLFGNGAEFLEVGGEAIYIDTYDPAPGYHAISIAILDIWDVTNGYLVACPRDRRHTPTPEE